VDLLGDAPPTQGSDETVRVDLVGAEQLGHAAGGHVPTHVHLPEAVLGVHEALGTEQVVAARRDDRGYAVAVAEHLDRCRQAGKGHVS
jgi:hypothetical protein